MQTTHLSVPAEYHVLETECGPAFEEQTPSDYPLLEDMDLSHMPRLFLGQQSLYLECKGVGVGGTLEIF